VGSYVPEYGRLSAPLKLHLERLSFGRRGRHQGKWLPVVISFLAMSTGLTRSNTHAASSLARSSTLRGTRGGAGGGGDEGGGSSSTSLARASSVAVGSMSRFRNAFGAVLPDKFYEGLAVAVTSPALLRVTHTPSHSHTTLALSSPLHCLLRCLCDL